ncbi:MAG: GMC family oxidoreductase N-terminal domain-containing protein [Rhizomicrobium sp.]
MARDGQDYPGDIFDYVIVGAGSAGCVLANRLSADPAIRVCLLEAGPKDRSPYIHIPLGFIGLIQHPELNWRFMAAPQSEINGRQIYVPRGRVLGGTSSLNGMVYIRGHPTDYDDWAAAGNTGWSFADVLPYFKRSENNANWRSSPFHGTDGPLAVTDHGRTSKMGRLLIEAAQSLQFPVNSDFNQGDKQEGFGFRQVTQRNGLRQSAAAAFLAPVRTRPNLKIITGCSVDRIRFRDGRAVGVDAHMRGETTAVRAAREVIVSAGAIASPLILLRSGIGDGDALRRHGIGVQRHLPGVGHNLQDHTCIGIDVCAPKAPSYGISLRAIPALIASAFEYALTRRGMFASNIVEAGGFVRTDPSLHRPNLSYTFMSARRNVLGGRMGRGHGYALIPQLLRPRSRGQVALGGPGFDAPPWIDMGLLKDADDLEVLLQGLKLGRRILDTPAFRNYGGFEELPGREVMSDDQLRRYIRQFCATAFHTVGTCRMGTDEMAVVDPTLRVRGIDGLRVVDGSVMPNIVGGNTNAPIIMIAEKASDMILGRPGPAPQLDR